MNLSCLMACHSKKKVDLLDTKLSVPRNLDVLPAKACQQTETLQKKVIPMFQPAYTGYAKTKLMV